MKLISELKDAITWGEEHYLNFESKSREDNQGIIISGNEAKQIVKIYELLEDLMNVDEIAGAEFKVLNYVEEFKKLKGE